MNSSELNLVSRVGGAAVAIVFGMISYLVSGKLDWPQVAELLLLGIGTPLGLTIWGGLADHVGQAQARETRATTYV